MIKTIYYDFANVGTIFNGINSYTFDVMKINYPISELFDMGEQNIDNLKQDIYALYRGKKISAFDLFEEHQITGNYSRSHYAKALRKLVSEGLLEASFIDEKNLIVTVLISKDCILNFK